MQRSVSAIRMNDTNKSNFTIGYEDQIFSKQEFDTMKVQDYKRSQKDQMQESQKSLGGH